jgi:hypothetical protein
MKWGLSNLSGQSPCIKEGDRLACSRGNESKIPYAALLEAPLHVTRP